MNQKEKVRLMLETGRPICGVQFQQEYVGRFGARIHELRTEGMRISRRLCMDPYHGHVNPQWQYQLED